MSRNELIPRLSGTPVHRLASRDRIGIMNKWFFTTAGCACLAAAVLWQPVFDRELIVCGLVALIVAVGGYLRNPGDRVP